MKTCRLMVAAIGIAFGLTAPVSAASSDPENVIYRFPGVRDNDGAPNSGIATAFFCTNFSGATELIRFVTRNHDGTLLTNVVSFAAHLVTVTASTHVTTAYTEDHSLQTGLVNQGTTAIAATSVNIVCTAMTIDAAAAAPVGVALRGIRFNPAPGSQE